MVKVSLSDLIYGISDGLDYIERDLMGVATNHGRRVALLSAKVGCILGMSQVDLCDLACCAAFHDNALTEFLLYERASNQQEREMNLKAHCEIGEQNMQYFPFAGNVQGFIRDHHENADGSGPFGKTANQTPVGAQIIHIADNVDVHFPCSHLDEEQKHMAAQHVCASMDILYAKDVAEAFLEVLYTMAPQALHNENISATLRETIPNSTVECSNLQMMELADVFSRIIDYKSPFTSTHSQGIAQKTLAMMRYYGEGRDMQAKLYLAAALHDVGKLAIPLQILEKPGKLTSEEFHAIKKHVYYSHEMLSGVEGFGEICTWACDHHEKLDGSGYWFGKGAAQMDRYSRLLGCMDIYQAVREERPYHPANDHKTAMNVLWDLARHGKVDADITADMHQVLADFRI